MLNEIYSASLGFGVLLIFLLGAFFLNRKGKSVIVRFGLAVLPHFFLLLPDATGNVGTPESFPVYSFVLLGLTVIPLVLFYDRKSHNILLLALSINLLFVIFFDVMIYWIHGNSGDINLLENNYVHYKLPQIVLWIVIVCAFQYVKGVLAGSENQLQIISHNLRELNQTVGKQNKELDAKDDALSEYETKVEKQRMKLASKKNELKNTKIELIKSIDKLRKAKETIDLKEAEAEDVLNALNENYLVAQYDLNGKLQSISTKVIELLGALHDEHFHQIRPVIEGADDKNNKSPNGKVFEGIWNKILGGEAQSIDLDYQSNGRTLTLATTFAALFDASKKPYKILTIGHDVSELKEKNEKLDKINAELKERIFEISQKNELLSFQQSEIFDKSEELHRQKEEIQAINRSLEQRVKERTKLLEDRNKQLTEFAFINSHILRSPVSTMMGLINLLNYPRSPEEELQVYEHLKTTALKLDDVVQKIHRAIENGLHFDRGDLSSGLDSRP
ncbi:MAG: hypothetical protein MI975_02340 [Cytophagales bacterium]|nr:hypothetical protein [Cytophagales bacterium]